MNVLNKVLSYEFLKCNALNFLWKDQSTPKLKIEKNTPWLNQVILIFYHFVNDRPCYKNDMAFNDEKKDLLNL